MPELIQRRTSLSANIVSFCRYLRTEGFAVAAPEEADALRAVEILQPYATPESMRLALKTVLTRAQVQAERFDKLYDYYWKQVEKGVDSKIKDDEKSKTQRGKPQRREDAQLQALKNWLYGNQKSEEELDLHTYSAAEALGKKDFSAMSEDELREVFDLIKMIAQRLARQNSRRYEKKRRGALDLRRTLRQNLRRGGEMVDILRKKRPKKRLQLVLLCDVSKSMDMYSRFLVQFAYAFQQVFRRVETFVFSTALVRVSGILRGGDFGQVLEELSENTPIWSSGTRIGESLATFVNDYGRKCLTSKSIVVVLSDGWDTGDAALLGDSMAEIHKKAAKVIWLNPLAGNPNYQPTASGMTTVLPHVDVFASAHNAESLRALGKWLKA